MCINCAPLLADCLYTLMKHTSIKGFSKLKIENKPKRVFQLLLYLQSLNNSRFSDHLHLTKLNELEKWILLLLKSLLLTFTLKSMTNVVTSSFQ